MYPLTTTTARIDACHPCNARRNRAAQLLGIAEPSEEPIFYVYLLDTLGLEDALWCCRAEPDLAPIWRRYAVWCARQVQHLMTDERSLAALDVAERYANGGATDTELDAARDAARAAVDVAVAAVDAATDAARADWGVSAWAAVDATVAAARAPRTAVDATIAHAWAAAADTSAAVKAARDAAHQKQAAAFRQLVATGTLPT